MTVKPDPGQRPQPPAPRGPIRAHLVNAWRYSVIFLAWYSVKTFLFLKSHIHIKLWFGGNAREESCCADGPIRGVRFRDARGDQK